MLAVDRMTMSGLAIIKGFLVRSVRIAVLESIYKDLEILDSRKMSRHP